MVARAGKGMGRKQVADNTAASLSLELIKRELFVGENALTFQVDFEDGTVKLVKSFHQLFVPGDVDIVSFSIYPKIQRAHLCTVSIAR